MFKKYFLDVFLQFFSYKFSTVFQMKKQKHKQYLFLAKWKIIFSFFFIIS
jgi:hypothetical protein